MSHKTATQITRVHANCGDVDVFAEGKFLRLVLCDDYDFNYTREEALLLVEAITARLAEVTEGQ